MTRGDKSHKGSEPQSGDDLVGDGVTGSAGSSDPTLSQVQNAFNTFVQHGFTLPDDAANDSGGPQRAVSNGRARRRSSTTPTEARPPERLRPEETLSLTLEEPEEPEAVPLAPVNWNLLTAAEAEFHWRDLDTWVSWLRRAYGLGPAVIPPSWHRHEELVWELSALHTAWLAAYDPDADPGAPLAWQRDFADARYRLTDWVVRSGTKLSSDRATRVTTWPGEPVEPATPEHQVLDRAADFEEFIADDVAQRRAAEAGVREARPSSSPNHDENGSETA